MFKYRDELTFPAAVGLMSETLGLGDPIALEGVLIDASAVRVPIEFDMDVSEAMDKVVGAFDQVRNTLAMKVPEQTGPW